MIHKQNLNSKGTLKDKNNKHWSPLTSREVGKTEVSKAYFYYTLDEIKFFNQPNASHFEDPSNADHAIEKTKEDHQEMNVGMSTKGGIKITVRQKNVIGKLYDVIPKLKYT